MNATEPLGYLASLLVLATFCMRGMVALRALAMASNLAFIAYAVLAGIHPVLVLHALLLPMNAWRLARDHRASARRHGRGRVRAARVTRLLIHPPEKYHGSLAEDRHSQPR